MLMFILFVLFQVQAGVFGQTVSLSAPISFAIGADFSMRCELSDTTGISDINSFMIYRDADAALGTDESKIVSVDYNRSISGSVVQWQNSMLELRGAASGNVDAVDSAFIELNLTQSVCNDSATYRCTAFVTTGGVTIISDDQSIGAIASPGEMNAITATAIEGTIDQNGVVTNETMLNISCSGSVGNPAGNIRWCWKLEGATYQEVTSGITESVAVAAGNCQLERTSTLEYNVTDADTMTMFLCEVNGTYACGSAPYKSEFSITTVQTTTDNGGANGSSKLNFCGSAILLAVLSIAWLF
ncbi:uncharacterized protein [Argopecten irradians]|uniref:uncharacterized protein n=1 Tax=Argopecten irradians TaxID=31199 RepID=UPI003718A30D